MTTFVLVHGAWHGAWSWRGVERVLRAAGHEVLAPTLTGLADRSHLLTPSVGLALHVADVVNLVQTEQVMDAVLVGHSYGGMLVTAVATALPARFRELAVIDGFLPERGESAMALLPERSAERYQQLADEQGDGWRIPVRSARSFGVTDEAVAAAITARLTEQPLATFTDPSAAAFSAVGTPGRFLLCTGWPTSFGFAADRAEAQGWQVERADDHHEAVLTDPERVAAWLLA